jgi:hypothetical protein
LSIAVLGGGTNLLQLARFISSVESSGALAGIASAFRLPFAAQGAFRPMSSTEQGVHHLPCEAIRNIGATHIAGIHVPHRRTLMAVSTSDREVVK